MLAFSSFLSSTDVNALLSRPKYPLVHKSIRMNRDSKVLLPPWRRPFPRKSVKVSVICGKLACRLLLVVT